MKICLKTNFNFVLWYFTQKLLFCNYYYFTQKLYFTQLYLCDVKQKLLPSDISFGVPNNIHHLQKGSPFRGSKIPKLIL